MKSGTHLLHKLPFLLTGEKWAATAIGTKLSLLNLHQISLREQIRRLCWASHEYISSHFQPHEAIELLLEQRPKVKALIMVRDPRDVLISLVHYIEKTGPTYVYLSGFDYRNFKRASFEEKLLGCIRTGIIKKEIESAFYFSRKLNTCLIKIENLVGPCGGGSEELQEKEVLKVVRFLGINITSQQLKKCCRALFGTTPTFRKGHIGITVLR